MIVTVNAGADDDKEVTSSAGGVKPSVLPGPWWWPWLVLIVLPVVLYGQAFSYGLFGLDDDTYYGNPALQGGALGGAIALWGGFWFNDYSPVTQLTQWLDLALGDGVTWHVARIQSSLWLGFGAAGVYAFLRRVVDARTAFAIAVLYVVHPLCANSVLWLAERKNLCGIALTWWSLERYVAWRTVGGWGKGVAMAVIGAGALLAKPHAVALPAMMAGWEVACGPGDWRRAFMKTAWDKPLALAPMGILTAGLLWLEFANRHDFATFWFGDSRGGAVLCDGDVLARYLVQILRPVRLTIYYATDEDPSHVLRHLSCWLAVVAVVVASVVVAKRRNLVMCGWMVGLAGLLPALNLILQPVPVTDHYVQWALPGILLAVGVAVIDGLAPVQAWLVAQGARIRQPAAILAAALVCQFAVLTWMRVPEFTDRAVFFAHAAKVQPDCAQNVAADVSNTVQMRGLVRYQPDTGKLALHAARLPDARRILSFALEDTAIEAAVQAWREEGRMGAYQVINPFPAGVHSMDEAYWIQAKVLIGGSMLKDDPNGGPICLQEADELLRGHFGPELLAAADAMGSRCRDGSVLPDAIPPVCEVPIQGGDPFYAAIERRDRLRLGLVLAEVRHRAGDDASAFALAALCYNLEPRDMEARWTIAWMYDVGLRRKDLTRRLQAQWTGK